MLGAIAGDVIGSVYEFYGTKETNFALFSKRSTFTDDTVLTVAAGVALMDGLDYADTFRSFGLRYPRAGYGLRFIGWLNDPAMGPYQSWGNGSAMRVSPVGLAATSVEQAVAEARRSAEVTHDHPEGIRGAEATALAVFLASHGADKDEIKRKVVAHSGYDLDRRIEEIRPGYAFDESCLGTVPPAIMCFLESRDYEHAVRLAVSLGGDADTLAAITGAIAAPHYGGVPEPIASKVRSLLTPDLLREVDRFDAHCRR